MSSSSSNRRPRGGGGGRGRGRGRNNSKRRNSGGRGGASSNSTVKQPPDEDVLIEFMPFMRNQHPAAMKIHQQHGGDERAFVQAARDFLRGEKELLAHNLEKLSVEDDPIIAPVSRRRSPVPISRSRSPLPSSSSPLPPGFHAAPPGLPGQQQHGGQQHGGQQHGAAPRPMMPQYNQHQGSPTPPPGMRMQQHGGGTSPRPMPGAPGMSMMQQQQQHGAPGMSMMQQQQQQQGNRSPMMHQQGNRSPMMQHHGSPTPPGMPPAMHPRQQQQQAMAHSPPRHNMMQQQQHNNNNGSPMPPSNMPSPMGVPNLPPGLQQPSALKPAAPGLAPAPQQQNNNKAGNRQPNAPGAPPEPATTEPPAAPAKPPKPVWQPKRIWTRLDQQPGRIFANNGAADGPMIHLRPRQELIAKWVLPLKYLRQRMQEKERVGATIRDALQELTVGLFRRGCTENGTNASIISKEILAPSTENRNDYPYKVDQRTDCIYGTVPFYAPRTPGHVLFRLYWQDEPLYTLATGPTLFVRVSEEDFESTMRFILSNFKSRKGSATSLSSLNALSTVLDQFRPSNNNNNRRNNSWDSAGRAAWGCICESRKVLEVCASEHLKGREKLRKLEEEVEELKVLVEEEKVAEEEQKEEEVVEEKTNKELSPTQAKLKDKTHALMGGRASNDRKWKDSQVSFANILKAVVLSPNASLLFRRELIAKIRLEFELWCSLVDAFAPSPFNSNPDALCVNFNEFPQHVTPPHYQLCAQSRQKMQKGMLGFVPNKKPLQEVLFKSGGGNNNNNNNNQQQAMNRGAVDAFNSLSSAMGKLYEDVYMVADRILQQREMVRSHLQNIVAQCGDAFPPGTRVMVFGSSANGFGSPSSDLDMCLQLPPNTKLPGAEEDPTGALAMGKLALALESSGMQNVDTARLTARIPIIMFNCPRPMAQEGEPELMECDLSFLNSLAVLNTSLLLSYSRIHPVTRVLASIIKRWAKARDINNPSKHTLSSYGYIIMLLHFLTYHRRKGNGLITSIETERTSNNPVTFGPLLPNLQRMDPAWLGTPAGQHPYAELERVPQQLMQHPLEEKMVVNTYFHRANNAQELAEIQKRFPSQDLSLAILLASFFRYFAFEFDYKRHVVSMNSTMKRGMIEREIKAETHGWKVYSTGLAIEDPFETFYDVAHVLKGGNFHRLRNELGLAYTKIVNAVENGTTSGIDLINLICEPLEKDEAAAK